MTGGSVSISRECSHRGPLTDEQHQRIRPLLPSAPASSSSSWSWRRRSASMNPLQRRNRPSGICLADQPDRLRRPSRTEMNGCVWSQNSETAPCRRSRSTRSFRITGIPQVGDLNVLPPYRRARVGTMLLDAIEAVALTRSPVIGLGVGAYSDYVPAQRLYTKRGSAPEARGVVHGNNAAVGGEVVKMDLVLMLTRTCHRPTCQHRPLPAEPMVISPPRIAGTAIVTAMPRRSLSHAEPRRSLPLTAARGRSYACKPALPLRHHCRSVVTQRDLAPTVQLIKFFYSQQKLVSAFGKGGQSLQEARRSSHSVSSRDRPS